MAHEYERLNQEASKDAAEGYLNALLHFLVSGYYLDLKNGRYTAIGQELAYNERYHSEDDWERMDDYIRECINEEDQPLITEVTRIAYIRKRLKKEQSFSVEVRDHGSGAERWFRYTTMRGADEDHAAISFLDVTEQVLQRQNLEQMTRAVRTELELNDALGIYTWRITVDENDNMRYIDWSESACAYMGISAKAGIHASMRTMYSIIDPDRLPAFIAQLQKTIMAPEGEYVLNFDNRHEEKDGTVRWYHCTGRMIRFAENGEKTVIGAFREVTDTYLLQEERRELTEVRDLMQAARWTMRFDFDGRPLSIVFSDEVRRGLGYDSQEDFPNDLEFWRSIIHPDDVEARDTAMANAAEDREGQVQYDAQLRLKCKDGSYLWVRSAMRIHRDEAGIPVFAVGVFTDINDTVLRAEAEKRLREMYDEQNAQLEEITALNSQLEENQTRLEETSAEQEAQLEEIKALNTELESSRNSISEAYGMIEGFSTPYHTIWLVDKETSRMRLIRSTGKSTIQNAVQMGKDLPEFDRGFDKYIETYVEPEDRERMHREIAFTEILRRLKKGGIYAVNYLRRDDSGHVGYHQIAFANADTDNARQFVYGFRDVDDDVRAELEHTRELEEATKKAEEEQKRVSEAYGMIEGFSQEYHTIWLVNKETSRMRLIRTNGKSTIQNAVQMGKDLPEFDRGFEKYIETYVEPEDRERMHREIAFAEILRQLEKGGIYAVSYLRRDESGHVGYHQIAFANADTDSVRQFVYGFRDIDAITREEQRQKEELKKAKEAAEAANAAKTLFLFNMSHDIRTPMNAIMGFRDLLEKHQEDPDKRRDYLRKIQDSSTVLLSILNNVLEMARIEKGTLEIDEYPWSTEQFNDTLYSVFREMMAQKGLTFTRQIDVKHHYVFCDPAKLREIFINIISNAYKYTNPGGSVNMHLQEIPCDREGWVLYKTTITDTGIGMSEEFLPHIFEEFARENNTTEAKVEGTGLGMPIVKRLVEMLGGTVEVTSKKGEGTTFIVTLPHRIADKSDMVDHSKVEYDPEVVKGKRILLAEDNDFNAEIAMETLEEAGFLVDRAGDGTVCVDMLKNSRDGYYDLILMDIQMPNMNGYEATRTIRAMEDDLKAGIRIIAMTANAFEEDKREAMAAGMDGHLAKPVRSATLLRTLAEALEQKNNTKP